MMVIFNVPDAYSYVRFMTSARTIIMAIIAVFVLVSGCTTPFNHSGSAASTTSDETVPASYQIRLAQPDARSDLVRTDSDVYNAGEVIEFTLTNNALIPLECRNTPPGFRVTYQTGSGRWATKMGPEVTATGNISFLQKGESTQTYRFISTGWEPGRYRIVSDCGPERDFLIRALPTPVPTPITPACPAGNSTNLTTTAPYISIDPIGDQVAARPFTITGTTSFPAGTELRYSILFAGSPEDAASLDSAGSFFTIVEEGRCGINTWTAAGEIQATGEFFIGIEDKEGKATGIKRFIVKAP